MKVLLLILALCLFSSSPVLAIDDDALARWLSLLSTVQMGQDYAKVKKRVPELGALQDDGGGANMEARVDTMVDGVRLRGEFNFSNGHLVSHGFSTDRLSHEQAHRLLLRSAAALETLLGPSERRIELPFETDGDGDSIGVSFNWHKDGTFIGLDFSYGPNGATVSWGAQAE